MILYQLAKFLLKDQVLCIVYFIIVAISSLLPSIPMHIIATITHTRCMFDVHIDLGKLLTFLFEKFLLENNYLIFVQDFIIVTNTYIFYGTYCILQFCISLS